MTKRPKLVAVNGDLCEHTPQSFYNDMTVDVFARTLWGEARSEGTEGMEAVASVILNRVKVADENGSFWWGNNIIQVCQKPYQFSCWNRSDPNFKKLTDIDEKDLYFITATRIARRAMLGFVDDITKGATHYHTRDIMPFWAKNQTPTARIGAHLFYRLVS